MDVVDQEFRVAFRYPVHFTRGVFGVGNGILREVLTGQATRTPVDLVVVVDEGVARSHSRLLADIEAYVAGSCEALRLGAPPLVVPGGERSKNDSCHLGAIYRLVNAGGVCRQSFVVAVGGGALLDVAGYAAATAHRGVRLVRVPTTVLAQDDSAMGVKNGVNAFGKKNYLGTFAPPAAVINDFDFLSTLQDRDWRSGLSEAIKAALIRDAAFFAEIEAESTALMSRNASAMERVVRRSALIHLHHIGSAGDPFEQSSSRPLDFGHWAAHRLEQLTNYRLRHGEAVAIGIALDSTYSFLLGALAPDDWRRIMNLLLALDLSVCVDELTEHLDEPGHPRSPLKGLSEFREHLGGPLTIMLLKAIGSPFDVHDIKEDRMVRGIRTLAALESARISGSGSALVQQLASAR